MATSKSAGKSADSPFPGDILTKKALRTQLFDNSLQLPIVLFALGRQLSNVLSVWNSLFFYQANYFVGLRPLVFSRVLYKFTKYQHCWSLRLQISKIAASLIQFLGMYFCEKGTWFLLGLLCWLYIQDDFIGIGGNHLAQKACELCFLELSF